MTPLLHDDPRGGPADHPLGRPRDRRRGVRARDGRPGEDHRPGAQHDPPVGQGARRGHRDRGRRPPSGGEDPRGALRSRRAAAADTGREDLSRASGRAPSRSGSRGRSRGSRNSCTTGTPQRWPSAVAELSAERSLDVVAAPAAGCRVAGAAESGLERPPAALQFRTRMQIIKDIGSYAGFAAVVGLAVLAALYFSQARDLKRLREWAGRAPDREPAPPVAPQRVVAQPCRGRARRSSPARRVPARARSRVRPERPARPRSRVRQPAPVSRPVGGGPPGPGSRRRCSAGRRRRGPAAPAAPERGRPRCAGAEAPEPRTAPARRAVARTPHSSRRRARSAGRRARRCDDRRCGRRAESAEQEPVSEEYEPVSEESDAADAEGGAEGDSDEFEPEDLWEGDRVLEEACRRAAARRTACAGPGDPAAGRAAPVTLPPREPPPQRGRTPAPPIIPPYDRSRPGGPARASGLMSSPRRAVVLIGGTILAAVVIGFGCDPADRRRRRQGRRPTAEHDDRLGHGNGRRRTRASPRASTPRTSRSPCSTARPSPASRASWATRSRPRASSSAT